MPETQQQCQTAHGNVAAAVQEEASNSTSNLLDSLATLDDHPRSLYTAGAGGSSAAAHGQQLHRGVLTRPATDRAWVPCLSCTSSLHLPVTLSPLGP